MPLLCEGCETKIGWTESTVRVGGRPYHPGCAAGIGPQAPPETVGTTRPGPSRAIILGALIVALAALGFIVYTLVTALVIWRR